MLVPLKVSLPEPSRVNEPSPVSRPLKVVDWPLPPTINAMLPPLVSSTRVQEMCGIDRKRMSYALSTTSLPQGTQNRPGGVRSFTVAEAIEWVRAELKPAPRQGRGKIITVANFKGGVTKTTTSTLLAQGLSMRRGRKVGHIDLDPQLLLA